MALKWVEGFESYSNLVAQIANRYTTFGAGTSSFLPGRAIGNCLNFTGTQLVTPNLGNQTNWFVGFAFNNVNLNPAVSINIPIFELRDSGTVQLQVTFNPNTRLFSIWRGTQTVLLGTGVFTVTPGAWYYIEIGALINAAIGTVTFKVNTVSDITFGPGNTQVSANAFANVMAWKGPFGSVTGAYQLDDMYINDSTTALNSTFLGDMKVEGVQVIESGFYTQWGVNVLGTPNFQAVQVLADGLYTQSNTIGQKDSFECSNLNKITGGIAGVSAIYWSRNTDSTIHTVESLVRQGGVDYLGTAMSISDTAFKAYQTIWEQDPSTVAAWTVAGVGTAEFGYRLAS